MLLRRISVSFVGLRLDGEDLEVKCCQVATAAPAASALVSTPAQHAKRSFATHASSSTRAPPAVAVVGTKPTHLGRQLTQDMHDDQRHSSSQLATEDVINTEPGTLANDATLRQLRHPPSQLPASSSQPGGLAGSSSQLRVTPADPPISDLVEDHGNIETGAVGDSSKDRAEGIESTQVRTSMSLVAIELARPQYTDETGPPEKRRRCSEKARELETLYAISAIFQFRRRSPTTGSIFIGRPGSVGPLR